MDAHATLPIPRTQSIPHGDRTPADAPCPARMLGPRQRRQLAVAILAGAQTISETARQHQVSRKFLHRQAHTADQALDQAFAPSQPADDVLFYVPVTKRWIEQLVLALVLVCHSSLRGVVELLADLFDYPIALGTVHNIVQSAVPQARRLNAQYDLSAVTLGAHDEIFQADTPVLVGVDTASTFCYLLSPEQHLDADTWGVRLLELRDRGFAPDAVVADGGVSLRAGHALALVDVPCRADLFHLLRDGTELTTFLENRAYNALANCERLRQKGQRYERREGRKLLGVGRELYNARAECDAAIGLYDDVTVLLDWLRADVLAVAGPCVAQRRELYDFVLAELEARMEACAHRLKPICRVLRKHRDDFLAFALAQDEALRCLGEELHLAPGLLRRVLALLCRGVGHPQSRAEEQALRACLRGRYFEVCEAVAPLVRGTVRSSSLAENLNSRLRGYFFLRRQLGGEYLSLLQFFLNHRALTRSARPERVGRTPAELLTGQAHLHWLSLLGYTRFARR